MQTITIGAVSKEPKNFNNETSWGIKVGNSWMDFHPTNGNKPVKGETYQVKIEDVQWKGKTYQHAYPVKDATPVVTKQPDNPTPTVARGNRTTPYTHPVAKWDSLVSHAVAMAKGLGITDHAAVVSFVAIYAIPFGDGKLAMEESFDDEWGGATPATPIVEKNAAHIHLLQVAQEYGEYGGFPKGEELEVLAKIMDVPKVTEADVYKLTEKQAIQLRMKMEEVYDKELDFKKILTKAAKDYFPATGLNWDDTSSEVAYRKTAILLKCGIKSFKDATNAEAKAALKVFNQKKTTGEL